MFWLFYWICFFIGKKEIIEPDYFFFDEETGELHSL